MTKKKKIWYATIHHKIIFYKIRKKAGDRHHNLSLARMSVYEITDK